MEKDKVKELTSMETELKRELGLFEAVSIIAGIMIGSGIFYIGSFVLDRANLSPGLALFSWVFAGIFTLMSGLCYAELGAAMPRAGGGYVYLTEAYGPIVGFTMGWSHFWVSYSGSISALGLGFAIYLSALIPMSDLTIKLVAAVAIIIFTIINILGVEKGGKLQNILLVIKLIPIIILLFAGIMFGDVENTMSFSLGNNSLLGTMSLSVIAALWAFEGWDTVNIVTEEIKEPQRNLPIAMVIAIGGVTVIYALFNYALMKVLPVADIVQDANPASTAAFKLFGATGGFLITIGAMISILGSLNGCVLANPREYYAMARNDAFFSKFKKVHPKYKTPVNSLIFQMIVSIGLLFTGTFEQLTTLVVFTQWIFYTLAIASVFVLRKKYPDIERPYKVIGYPVLPLITILISVIILINTLIEDPRSSLMGLIVPLIGIPVYFLFDKRNKHEES